MTTVTSVAAVPEVAAAAKKRGAPRKRKNPDKPLRAKTGWIIYASRRRQETKALNAKALAEGKTVQKLSMTEETTLFGKEWKLMTKEDKKPFDDEAQKDKERFNTEMAEYNKKKEAGLIEEKD